MGSSRVGLRGLVGTLVVSLATAGLSTFGVATPVHAAPANQETVTERPDSVSASITARVQDHRVEDLSQRTETTQVFANPDGSWTNEEAAAPVRTQDESGNWSDIDLTLKPVEGGYAPAHALDDLVISDGGDQTFAEMTVDGRDLGWTWPEVLPEPTIEGDTATYPNVVDGGDLVVTATASGFRHDIVLRQAPADPVAFDIPVVTAGPKLTEEQNGELSVTTKSGDELVSAAPPVMYDAPSPETGTSAHEAPVDTTVTQTATGAVMTLDPDEAFLNDPDVTYPVTIDPTFSSTNPDDTWVYNTSPNAYHPGDTTLYVGTPNAGTTKYRSFVRFNGNTTPWSGATVSSATFSLRNFNSSGTTCSGTAVEVRRITGPWEPNTATWNNLPGSTTTNVATSTARKGGQTGCATDYVSWNVTGIAQDWANGSPNYGLAVRGSDETKTATYREYRAAGYSATTKPLLSVTYNHAPNVPTSLSASPTDADGYVTSQSPTLSAQVADLDGGSVSATFTVKRDDGTTAWSGTGTTVPSGSLSTVVVPSNTLASGSYTMIVNASDGSLQSGASASMPFTIIDVPTVPDGLSISPCLDDCDPEWQYTSSLTPTLSATSTKPNSTTLTYQWEVERASDAAVVATGTSTGTSGLATAWQVPAAALLDDGSYVYHVRASDGGVDWSDWSQWAALGVDTDAPTTSQAVKDEAANKFTGFLAAKTDVWNQGQAAVDSPSQANLDNAGGPSPALTSSLNDTEELRDSVVTEGLSLNSVSITPGTIHVRQTLDGYVATTSVTVTQNYTDSDGTQTDSSWAQTTSISFASGSSPTANPITSVTFPQPASDFGDPNDITAAYDGGPDTSTAASSTDRSQAGVVQYSGGTIYVRSYNPFDAAQTASIYTGAGSNKDNQLPGNYPSWLNFGDNCTNFLSRVLDMSGWQPTGGTDTTRTSNWNYDVDGPARWTHTWSVASYLYQYAYHTKKLKWMPNIWNAMPGDLYFIDWVDGSSSPIDHAIIVTGRTQSGVPVISSKSNNRHNLPLTEFIKLANKSEKHGVRTWYGLEDWTTP